MTTRLIDRILLEGVEFCYGSGEPLAMCHRELLQAATPVLIDNVAAYYFQNRGAGEWKTDDFPNIAPPFELMWSEFGGISPLIMHSDNRVQGREDEANRNVPRAVGVLSTAREVDVAAGVADVGDDSMLPIEYAAGEVRWHVRHTIFYEYPPDHGPLGGRPLCIGNIHLYITPEGALHPQNHNRMRSECYWRQTLAGDPISALVQAQSASRVMTDFVRVAIFPVLLATTFMHCRNTELEQDDSVPPKIRRAFLKRRRRPLVQFKVLNIGPVKQALRAAGAETAGTGLKRALGIRRGHFRHYGPRWGKGKLFGKYEGMFWTPAREVGDEKEGVVIKTYNVEVQQ